MAQLGTASVLFTDVVGSTELRSARGEDAAEDLRRIAERLFADAIRACNGRVVKGLGDGVLATFSSAADSVAGAAAIQRSVDAHCRRSPGDAFAVRVGLSTGDVTFEDSDVFGAAVVEASRLCGAAQPGEILAADTVRILARGRGRFSFEPVGLIELKGLPEPLSACRVSWEPAPAEGPQLPSGLVGANPTAFVGRNEALARLEAVWAKSDAGSAQLVLIAGEPGVGKTRLTAELGRALSAKGATILYGRCEDRVSAPYQPFVEALDWTITHVDQPVLGRRPGELARLVPDISSRVGGGLDEPVSADIQTEQHRLFDATASWLVETAQRTGLVLVIDDLHWANQPTLSMLLHVMRVATDEADVRLLVIGTYRDTDVDRAHPLSRALGDLRRLRGVERVVLHGLTPEEVEALVAAAAGHELDDAARALAGTVHAETEGNPFFVVEVLRHLVETGGVRREGDRWVVPAPDHLAVPEGVRDVVGRRLSQLSQTANAVLTVAAVLGRDFNLATVCGLVEHLEDDVVDALDEAVRARLIDEVAAERYRFAHALVRTTLYEELSATKRRRLHRRAIDVLEKLEPDDVVALAFHSLESGGDGDSARAIMYTVLAGEHAREARAPSEAETRFAHALEMLEEGGDVLLELRARCGLGECQRDLGNPAYRTTLLDAGWRALEVGAVDLAARALLSNNRGNVSFVGAADEERVRLAEEVLEALGPHRSHDHIRVMAYLANEVIFVGDHQRRIALADEAVRLARLAGDESLLVDVLARTVFAGITSDRWRLVVERTEEAAALAERLNNPALHSVALLFYGNALMIAGRIEESLDVFEVGSRLADTDAGPIQRWMILAQRPKLLAAEGRFAEANALNDEALQLGTALGEPDADVWWGAAVGGTLSVTADLSRATEMMVVFREQYPYVTSWAGGLAWSLAEAGRTAEALALLHEPVLEAQSLNDDPWPFVPEAQVAAAVYALYQQGLDVRDDAERAFDSLVSYDHGWVNWYVGLWAPVTLALAHACAAAGRHDDAVGYAERAIAASGDVGFRAIENLARLVLAEILSKRSAAGDAERATQLFAEVGNVAEVMGAEGVAVRAAAGLAGNPPFA